MHAAPHLTPRTLGLRDFVSAIHATTACRMPHARSHKFFTRREAFSSYYHVVTARRNRTPHGTVRKFSPALPKKPRSVATYVTTCCLILLLPYETFVLPVSLLPHAAMLSNTVTSLCHAATPQHWDATTPYIPLVLNVCAPAPVCSSPALHARFPTCLRTFL